MKDEKQLIEFLSQVHKRRINTGVALILLRLRGERAPMRIGDLTTMEETTLMSSANVTGLVDTICNKGLARRIFSREGAKEDRRAVYVELTPSGKNIAETLIS